ncbi:Fe-S cluster assembly protein SufD [Paenibacillus swuensis]|uniref:Fe-S cluster assembly protein SufD n=1 Tax=Paenibacillus swuensis TaxID=1178515 RepID=A0A172TN04_9BACL|nr:Fe-S cluster assembly protein SufD [Paenibacillus swuensis]ANE48469.1 Fe-S cluster assembly protein SufD [Paenibacillus swuensis]
MSTNTILPLNPDAVRALSESKSEPAWLAELRLKALELAGQLELPKPEKTNITRWNLDAYGAPKASAPIASPAELPQEALALITEAAQGENLLVQKDSSVVYTRLSAELASQGVIFTSLEEAAREHAELVQSYLMQAVLVEENRLTALHAAAWNGGVFLYVPRNVDVKVPLQALFYAEDSSATFAPHVLIVAEANSRVTYVDNYLSSDKGKPQVHNGVVEVFAKPGAKVQYSSIHAFGDHVVDLSYRRAVLENDSRMEWIVGELNDGKAVSETTSILKGNGSESDAKVLCVGSNDQSLNITTHAIHFGMDSDSQMITRAVMRDSASAIINGITKIEKGATRANGEQTEKVLMLSPKARGDANPILLIDEDDVTAGHAASVGQVNPEQVYYMMSRGISKQEAERLIIYGFLAPVVAEIPLEPIRNQLQGMIERKLGR